MRSDFASVTECDGLLLVPGNPFSLANRSNSTCPGSHLPSAFLTHPVTSNTKRDFLQSKGVSQISKVIMSPKEHVGTKH